MGILRMLYLAILTMILWYSAEYLINLRCRGVALACFTGQIISLKHLLLAPTNQALRQTLITRVVLNVQKLATVLRRLRAQLPLRSLLHLPLTLRGYQLVLLAAGDD